MNKYLVIIGALLLSNTLIAEHSVAVKPYDNTEWGLLNPLRGDASPKAVDLWGSRTQNTATGMLVKFEKGFSSPPHIHNISYRGIVIKGLMHNDDPTAEVSWLPSGSFWTQPAGESHITAANDKENLIYLEIDRGPYLVMPEDQSFDNGESAINVHPKNMVWLEHDDITWINQEGVGIAFLWGSISDSYGSLIRIPAGFSGTIKSKNPIKSVVIQGAVQYKKKSGRIFNLQPGSFFSSEKNATHSIDSTQESLIYVHTRGHYTVNNSKRHSSTP